MLHMTYNPYIKFNIKKIKNIKGKSLGFSYLEFITLLKDLSNRIITGNEAIDAVHNFLSKCNDTEIKWLTKVIQKDLKIGITEKTVNKVFGAGFIPTFSCMLAHPFKRFPKRYIEQPKLDGYRCLAFRFPDRAELMTRNGRLISGYTNIEQEIEKILPIGYMSDGEIMARGDSFNDTQSQVFDKKSKGIKDGIYRIFDMLTIDEFNAGKGKLMLRARLKLLDNTFGAFTSDHIELVPSSEFFTDTEEDIEKAQELYRQFVNEGYEGGMIKDLDAYYECKRTYATQKLKPVKDIDLPIIRVLPGETGTQFEHVAGSVEVDFNGNPVGIGSGLITMEVLLRKCKREGREPLKEEIQRTREWLWENRNNLPDTILEIKYQDETTNKQGTASLRFPTFHKLRYDK